MIRRMTISEDNVPKTTRISESISSSSGSIFIETGFNVSWAMVQNASVGQISADDEVGPVFFSPNSPTSNLVYDLSTITSTTGLVYVAGSLQVFQNGILLTKDVDYTENPSGGEFTLIVGSGGLSENPDSSDEFAIKLVKNVTFTAPGYTTRFLVRTVEGSTGFYLDYENVSGSLLVVDVVYR